MLQGGGHAFKSSRIDEYDGDQDDTILENFFWDVEEFLVGTPNLGGEAQVKEVATHLTRSAKLWWRTHQVDKCVGKPVRERKT